MGTNIYGSYDELVIELHGLDGWRSRRRELRVRVDDVWQVRSADPHTLVSFDGERVLRLGRPHGGRVVVLDLVPGAALDRIVVGLEDADVVAADLARWGVGAAIASVTATPPDRRVPVLVGG